MKLLIFVAFFFLGAFSFAETLQEPESLSVFHMKNGKLVEKKILYREVKPDLKFTGVSPHLNLNPELKTAEWSGLGFKNLLAGTGTGSPDEEITVVASNEYRAQFLRKDLAGEPEAMVAFYQDGKRIETRMGGAQTMFHTTHPKHSPVLSFDGYGVWFVTAILVGQFPAVIDIHEGAKVTTKKVEATSVRPERMFGPNGHCRSKDRICTPQNKQVITSYLSLGEFLRPVVSGNGPRQVTVDTFHGKKTPLGANWREYDIVSLWNGKSIPPKHGGPVQICPKGKVINCVFYARALHLEN